MCVVRNLYQLLSSSFQKQNIYELPTRSQTNLNLIFPSISDLQIDRYNVLSCFRHDVIYFVVLSPSFTYVNSSISIFHHSFPYLLSRFFSFHLCLGEQHRTRSFTSEDCKNDDHLQLNETRMCNTQACNYYKAQKGPWSSCHPIGELSRCSNLFSGGLKVNLGVKYRNVTCYDEQDRVVPNKYCEEYDEEVLSTKVRNHFLYYIFLYYFTKFFTGFSFGRSCV